MTDDQRRLFMAIEAVLAQQGAAFDDLCDAYAEVFRADADDESDDTVKQCLREAAEQLSNAGMSWYVSTK